MSVVIDFTSVGPDVQDLVVAFAAGDHPAVVGLLVLHHRLFGFGDELGFGIGSDQVVGREGQTAAGRFAEAELHHVVEQIDRGFAAEPLVAVADHVRQVARPHRIVVVIHAVGKHQIEPHASGGRFDDRRRSRLRVCLRFSASGHVANAP